MKIVVTLDKAQFPDHLWDDLISSARMLRNILGEYVEKIELVAKSWPIDGEEHICAAYKMVLLLPKGKRQLLIEITRDGMWRCRTLSMQWQQYLPEVPHAYNRDLLGNTMVRNELFLEILRKYASNMSKADPSNTLAIHA